MRRQRSYLHWVIAILGSMIFISGCGGDEESCADVVCPDGEQCVDGVCGGGDRSSCEPGCTEGEFCQGGRCVSNDGSCQYSGQACRRIQYGQFFDDFLCMDWTTQTGGEAVCSADCRDQACPDGGACFLVTVNSGVTCMDDGACSEGQFCYQGSCAYAACRPSDCDNPGGYDESCGAMERCEQIEGGSNMCVPTGSREVGEICIGGAQAFEESRLSEGCISEAVCVGGTCREYCDGGQCSAEGEECIDVAGPSNVEACVSSCDFGAEDSGCSDAESCVPTVDGGGLCQTAGSVEAFGWCTVGGEGCEVGMICAATESGSDYGRCVPICDLSVVEVTPGEVLSRDEQDARDATCPQVEPGEGAWTLWHLADSVGPLDLYVGDDVEPAAQINGGELADFEGEVFQRRQQGEVRWALREPGSAATDIPVAEGSFGLGAGQTQLVLITPEAGRDSDLESGRIELQPGAGQRWIQAIPDLEAVDLWAVDEHDSAALVLEDWLAGELRQVSALEGSFELRVLPAGADEQADALLIYPGVELTEDDRFVALRGTMDSEDIHPTDPPVKSQEEVPDIGAEAPLGLSCRAVNDGSVGGCLERCDGGVGLVTGRCQGDEMGCGPRYHEERGRWTTICQPVGDREEGEGCDPLALNPCEEGLYCEEYGSGAEHGEDGVCAPLCAVGDDALCGEGQGCRPVAYGSDYNIGECRTRCEPDGNYFDGSCPAGLQSCKPESQLVPVGDGVSAGFDLSVEQPYCWASGTTEIGLSCFPGDCIPGSECIYQRSEQADFIATLLSPYFGGAGGALPQCREICDPFLGEQAQFQCADSETCLFNYPWNANVGHCAEIVESREHGEACDHPGMACGEDSICVMEPGGPQCIQFCQFEGQGTSGYERSTCPVGYQCGPYVSDIGVCRSS